MANCVFLGLVALMASSSSCCLEVAKAMSPGGMLLALETVDLDMSGIQVAALNRSG